MTTVFIVRPFGKKPVTVKGADGKDASVDLDFDEIDRLLIQPALARNQLKGETTGVIARAGNIREDMFQMLIACDLVIADISIDNANVFYELGIRHGLRPKGTILIRFPTSGKDVPFDLKTDRYIPYDWACPAAAVDELAKSIKETLRALRTPQQSPDSPVFLLLPGLTPPDASDLLVVPEAFQDAVERAENDAKSGGTTLALLAEEAKRTPWGREGLRLVGRAQRRGNSFPAARETWEDIRKELPNDVEANLQLATIYQRLGDFVCSSQHCRRVIDSAEADRKDRSDARSQLARNEKALWVADFKRLPNEEARRRLAITDKRLRDAFDGYREGFLEDQNDYYSGINALGLLMAIVKLAEGEPDAWESAFPSARRAANELEDYQDKLASLCGAVRTSLDSAKRRAERTGKRDEWLLPSEAQFTLLTSANPAFVRNVYLDARNEGGRGFSVQSEAQQVALFHRLGLFPDNCAEALAALDVTLEDLDRAERQADHRTHDRVIVATGHRVDAPDRLPPGRFPNKPEHIASARAWLREKVAAEKAATAGSIYGIGGAASGTDLLFHDVCKELGIPTTVVVPIPIEDYRRESVADGGPDWIERFNRLVAEQPPILLSDDDMLPSWAETIPDYGVFQRGNIWMLEHALLWPDADVTLLALWNGKVGDGPGGTADMVALAESRGAKVCIKNTEELFGLGS